MSERKGNDHRKQNADVFERRHSAPGIVMNILPRCRTGWDHQHPNGVAPGQWACFQ
jgi:hypothetical protein